MPLESEEIHSLCEQIIIKESGSKKKCKSMGKQNPKALQSCWLYFGFCPVKTYIKVGEKVL